MIKIFSFGQHFVIIRENGHLQFGTKPTKQEDSFVADLYQTDGKCHARYESDTHLVLYWSHGEIEVIPNSDSDGAIKWLKLHGFWDQLVQMPITRRERVGSLWFTKLRKQGLVPKERVESCMSCHQLVTRKAEGLSDEQKYIKGHIHIPLTDHWGWNQVVVICVDCVGCTPEEEKQLAHETELLFQKNKIEGKPVHKNYGFESLKIVAPEKAAVVRNYLESFKYTLSDKIK